MFTLMSGHGLLGELFLPLGIQSLANDTSLEQGLVEIGLNADVRVRGSYGWWMRVVTSFVHRSEVPSFKALYLQGFVRRHGL